MTLDSLGRQSPVVVVRGAGDIATGTARRLFTCGFGVVMTEIAEPRCVRRTVSFAEAVYEGSVRIEDVTARRARAGQLSVWPFRKMIAVLVDPNGDCIETLRPDIVIDARMLERNVDTHSGQAPVVGGLGPGFTAGQDCHFVVETQRGHDLGRVITSGAAAENTGIPGRRGGHSLDRVLYTEAAGSFEAIAEIGDRVDAGAPMFRIGGATQRTAIAGIVRGMLRNGLAVEAGVKAADVDPIARAEDCRIVSDRSNAIAGGVLEGVFRNLGRNSNAQES